MEAMPIGITVDICATLAGSFLGILLGKRLQDSMKNAMNNVLGIAAISMGIVLIMRQHTLSAVVLAIVLGCVAGEMLKLENRINQGVSSIVAKLMQGTNANEAFLIQVSAVVVLFCCGGTGWYGALNEGLTGDGSILITKSILDFVTAVIFGSLLGKIVPLMCIPQAVVYTALYRVSGWIQPFITPEMIADFSAAGGIITFCAGLRLTGIKRDIRVLNMLPALVLVFFVSAGWIAIIH